MVIVRLSFSKKHTAKITENLVQLINIRRACINHSMNIKPFFYKPTLKSFIQPVTSELGGVRDPSAISQIDSCTSRLPLQVTVARARTYFNRQLRIKLVGKEKNPEEKAREGLHQEIQERSQNPKSIHD